MPDHRSELALHFAAFVTTLPPGAQQNIRDAAKRGDSITFDAFKYAWTAREKAGELE